MTTANGQVDPAEHIFATMADDLPSDTRTGNLALAAQATHEMKLILRKIEAKKKAFQSTGFSILRVTHDGEEKDVHVPIRSVPFDEYTELLKESYVEPPRSKKMDLDTMEYVMVLDPHDGTYQTALHYANTRFLKRFALRALDVDITDDNDTPVWTRDGQHRHEETALRILEQQGFTLGHFQQIREDAERMSVNSQEVQKALQLKKRS
jgi:hypothetical protein